MGATRWFREVLAHDADFADADLASAKFTGAELTGALWPPGEPVPAGWQRHTGSGQLIAAGTGADRAAARQPRLTCRRTP